ncbi:MAG: hypothetical protein WCX71_05430 [Candidatus Buchananbacteria bacterium]
MNENKFESEFFKTPEPPTPKAAEYLAINHEYLKDIYPLHCATVAEEVAKLIFEDGHTPQIEMVYQETKNEDGSVKPKGFLPKIYQGKIEPWFSHLVCCTQNLAFDPIIGQPVPKDDYTKLAFGEDINMEVQIFPDELKNNLGIVDNYG